MELYKRTVGYEEIGRTNMLVVTATTLHFPIFLKQSFEDIGIYTDIENPIYEVIDLSGIWDTRNDGTNQKPCLTLNNCDVSIVETPITFFNANNGALSATISSCSGPQTYGWTGPNGFTSSNLYINNLSPGNYTLKIADGNCDITYKSYFLQQPQGLSLDLLTTNSQFNATIGCNGSASVTPQGGQPPYQYLWYSGTPSNVLAGPDFVTTGLTNLCAGVYNVQITDASNTIVSAIFSITEPSSVSGTVVTTGNIDCFGGANGLIVLSASGGIASTGYTYVLSGPTPSTNTNGTFTNLLAGNYTAQIYDSVGGSVVLPIITITQPISITSSAIPTPVTCFGLNDGSITINPIGGNGTYNVDLVRTSTPIGTITSVTIPSGSYSFNNLQAGNYSITITDSSGCSAPTINLTITQQPNFTISTPILPTYNGYNLMCFDDSTGVTFTTLYTSGPFTSTIIPTPPNTIKYYLNGVLVSTCVGGGCVVSSVSTQALINLSGGTNVVTAVDLAGCSATTIVEVTRPLTPLSIEYGVINADDETCGTVTVPISTPICSPCGCGNCRQGVIDINGGVAPYTISWSDGSTLLTSNSHCEGTIITVTVTDANGCVVGPTNITLSP